MELLSKTLESSVRIHYHDCDPFNHLNNSRFIDYIVAARTEQLLDNYGFNTAELAQKHGIGWVVVQTQISYLLPAQWLEKVTIESRLISYSASSLLVEAIMWNEKKSHMKAIMWAKLVHFGIKSQQSLKHSEDLMGFFKKIHAPINGNLPFEERVKALKQLNHLT
jgi:acyl-CoA thioester hydrolase